MLLNSCICLENASNDKSYVDQELTNTFLEKIHK